MKRTLTGLALACALAAPHGALAQTSIDILTGAPSSVSYALGVALSQVYTKAIPEVKSSVQATRASTESLSLLQSGRATIAFAPGDALAAAWRGDEEAGFKTPLNKLRGLSATYYNYVQIVARADSGIRTVADLKGKRLAVGSARSTTDFGARAILRAAGLSYRDLAKVEYVPFGQAAELMKERQLDATLQTAVAGALAIRDLAMTSRIVLVTIPRDILGKAGEVYEPATLPANTYPGQTSDVPTAAIRTFLVTQSDVSEELGYQMTKALYGNVEALYAANSAAKEMRRENAVVGMRVPLHPGAEKYYREVGVIK